MLRLSNPNLTLLQKCWNIYIYIYTDPIAIEKWSMNQNFLVTSFDKKKIHVYMYNKFYIHNITNSIKVSYSINYREETKKKLIR